MWHYSFPVFSGMSYKELDEHLENDPNLTLFAGNNVAEAELYLQSISVK